MGSEISNEMRAWYEKSTIQKTKEKLKTVWTDVQSPWFLFCHFGLEICNEAFSASSHTGLANILLFRFLEYGS